MNRVLLLLFALLPPVLHAQNSWIRTTSVFESWYLNVIDEQPDGGFVVGYHMKALGGDLTPFVIQSYDGCGDLLWSKLFEGYVLDDLTVLDDGRIAALLSVSNDLAVIMLDGQDGSVQFLRYFDPVESSFSNFFNIDHHGDRLMVFGNTRRPQEPETRTAIILLNLQGDIIWCKKFYDNIDASEAIYTSQGHFLCTTSNLFFEVDSTGNILWGKKYTDLSTISNQMSPPAEVAGGYIFHAQRVMENRRMLVKIDPVGNILSTSQSWRSDFSAVSIMANEDRVLVPYIFFEGDENYLGLVLANHNAQILAQYAWQPTGSNDLVYFPQGIWPRENEVILTATFKQGERLFDLMASTDLQESCYLEPFSDRDFNQLNPAFEDVTNQVVPEDFDIDNQLMLNYQGQDFILPVQRICSSDLLLNDTLIEAHLDCGETFSFETPFPEATFQWNDGYEAASRTFDQPGQYLLELERCGDMGQIEFAITASDCPCEWYLPNVFSPNFDGVNDVFQAFSDCPVLSYRLVVFDRWGNQLFQSQDPEFGWDGTARNERLPAGAYTYFLEYAWEPYPGGLRREITGGSVALLR